MKNILYLGGLMLLVACNTNQKENTQTFATTPTGMQGLQQNQQTAAPVQMAENTHLIFNPAHGEPGHRCDLAVGAPLSQPTAPQPQPAVTTQPAALVAVSANTPAVPAAVAVSSKKLNPPHGEPGHRCDIAVGAPLNSKPAAPAAQATQTATPKNQPALTADVKINPAHGEPGHRCDIAVGAPLT